MRGLRAALLVGAAVALGAASTASSHTRQPVLRRPNPVFVSVSLDYVNPITLPSGTVVTQLGPLATHAIPASVRDLNFLRYKKASDLGNFVPAPIGWLATGNCYPPRPGVGCPGETLVGGLGPTQVPLYKHQAQRRINSYTWLHGIPGGKGAGCGFAACHLHSPYPLIPSNTLIPGPNQGFGGKTPKPKKPKNPNRPVSTGGGGDCGTKGISITSNLGPRTVGGQHVNACQIYVVNQAPGDGTFEKMRIENTTSTAYVLSLHATGTPTRLWQDLEMGVWIDGQPAPSPLPPLHFWTAQYNDLITLQPGQVVHYLIELYLPLSAGNADQHVPAVVDFNWRAVQKTG